MFLTILLFTFSITLCTKMSRVSRLRDNVDKNFDMSLNCPDVYSPGSEPTPKFRENKDLAAEKRPFDWSGLLSDVESNDD